MGDYAAGRASSEFEGRSSLTVDDFLQFTCAVNLSWADVKKLQAEMLYERKQSENARRWLGSHLGQRVTDAVEDVLRREGIAPWLPKKEAR
jgi:hypothetical protein